MELKDQDVTRTTYASSYKTGRKQPEESVSGKVEAVCQFFRKIISSPELEWFFEADLDKLGQESKEDRYGKCLEED